MYLNIENRINNSRKFGRTKLIEVGLTSITDPESGDFLEFLSSHGLYADVILREINEEHARYMFCWLMCNSQLLQCETDFDDDYVEIWESMTHKLGSVIRIFTNNRSLPIEEHRSFYNKISTNNDQTTCILISGNVGSVMLLVSDYVEI